MSVGKHVIIDMWKYDKTKDLESVLQKAAIKAGFTIMDSKSVAFEPQGESVSIIIAESHITAHTWPEYDYVAIDVFSCGSVEATYKTAIEIIRELNPEEYNMQVIDRG